MPRLTGNRCQCAACGEYFNGAQPFDRHRVGSYGTSRRCLTVADMEAAGFTRNAAGFWCNRARAEHALRRCAPVFQAHRGHRAGVGMRPATDAPR